jgi:hypothetical protein
MTVHSWFRGGKIRLSLINRVEHFIKFIEQGLADGELPAPTMVQTKDYLSRHAKL